VALKFFLNISKGEQRQRFLDRLEDPVKNWKFSAADVTERKLWDKYQAAYQDMIRHTASPYTPWYVVPADHKWFVRVVIGSTIVSAPDKLGLQFPKGDMGKFENVRKSLESERKGAVKSKRAAVKNRTRSETRPTESRA
jgi:hypothetical protein